MKKLARKKTILDFNHIDPTIPKEELEEIQNLYKYYKKQWWCFEKLYRHHKRWNLIERILSSVLIASGILAGGITLNPIVMGVLSGSGVILKTIHEVKNRDEKIKKAGFAFAFYEELLDELKDALRKGNFDKVKFLVENGKINKMIINYKLDKNKFEKAWKEKFVEDPVDPVDSGKEPMTPSGTFRE